jgi:RHS repeat-associated protein
MNVVWVSLNALKYQETSMSVRFSRLLIFLLLTVAGVLAPVHVIAQVSTHITYEEQIKKSRTFAALDEHMFGDKINLQDGAVSFAQDDVVLATNSNLKVAIGRMLRANIQSNTPEFNVYGGYWDLNVPYMMATYDSRDGWNAMHNTDDPRRCRSGGIAPKERMGPWPYYYAQSVYAHMYWKGVQINIPGYGQEQMLKLNAGQVVPTSGDTYYGTTKSHWMVGCLDSVAHDAGEGFKVTLPDGVTYYFDWMVKRKAVDLTDNGSVDNEGYGTQPWHLLAPLTDVYLYATKATDRFGNSVTYTYDAVYHNRIKTIQSNDGVRLDVQYNAAGLISAVVAENRTWTYKYDDGIFSLQLPDGSKWEYSGSFGMLSLTPALKDFWSAGCIMDQREMNAYAAPDPSSLLSMSIKHPSGARGDFTFRPLYHGINNAPGGCGVFGSGPTSWWYGTWGVPSASGVFSLHEKKISGPGMSDRIWRFSYAPSWSFQSQCSSGCASTSKTAVTTNDGVVRRYIYGNDYVSNHGQLLSETVEKNNVVVRSTAYTYLSTASGQPFPDNAGDIAKANGVADLYGNPFKFKNRPLKIATTQQDGSTFTRTATTFDLFARPTIIVKQSSLGYSKSDATEYHDNLSSWVLGQVKRQYNVQTGMVMSQTDFNSQALPWKTYSFGKLQQTLTYSADGVLATVADGRGNTTTLSAWKRGIPQQIQYPATPESPSGSTQSAVVDNSGWITSVTDENGYATGYGYDSVGRLASIVYPTADSVAWLPKTFEFRALTATDWLPPGISVGQWRQYEGQGNYAKFTYYDAMWRPVLVMEYDTSNVTPTLRYNRTAYDSSGRVSFQSYPTADATPTTIGTRTFYDVLDRVTKVEQDSEHNVLSTVTEYLAGLQVRVTNPRGHQTTTGFMAWDQPGYDLPLWSSQPEGKVIEIARHPQFGWPLQLKQRSADNALQATRQYIYDDNAQLCKTIEPETGATVTWYDAANNPVWSASGLTGGNYASTADCSYAAANASGRVVNRSYDARNRVSALTFPDGRGNQIWTYEKDGLPASVTAYNDVNNTTPVVTAYTYNKRRMLKGESLSQPGWYTWGIGYEYDPIGNLRWQSYPTGLSLDYAPNALGQSTGVRDQSNKFYASGASYYPNGALKQFTYGNGIVHTMTQNARQLPQRVTSSGGVQDFTYAYDYNGNVTRIIDEVRGGNYGRWMSYDGLDRLIDAGSCNFGGDCWHRFTYDALDNVKSWKLGGVKDYADYVYDAQNRLTSIRNTAGATVMGIDYDDQGNLKKKNGQIYEFDYGNRLRGVAGKEYYRYDGLGRRIMNWRYPVGTASFSQYSRSGQLTYQEDYHGSPTTASEHIYLAGSLIATRENVRGVGATIKYQHTDALGSPVAVTNQAGTVIERNDYEPYGAVIGQPNKNGIGYTGHMMDGATGLTYMQQRYYDQSLGRFLSVDPVTANAANGGNFNRYKYAANNPYRFTDPDGRQDAADRFGDQFKNDAEAGNSAVYEAFEKPAIYITTALITLTPVIGPIGSWFVREAVKPQVREGAAGGERAGKDFTRAGKREVVRQNQEQNSGQTKCEGCTQQTTPAQQSQRGVSTPENETRIDHIIPKSKGGDGSPSNGQVLCSRCNLDKSNKTNWVPPKNR